MKKRNGIISLWKFLFAIVIMFFHCHIFYNDAKNQFFHGGYIAVEFFFIVSGYYLCKKILKGGEYNKETIGKETISFVIEKLKKLFPYILISYIGYLIIVLCFYNYSLSKIANSIWNLLLLKEVGFKTTDICVQFWYITAMLLSMFITYPFLKKYRENFIYLISPLIIIFGLGYLNFNWIGLNHSYGIWTGLFYTGIIRAIVEINIGFIIYIISIKIQKIEFKKISKILLTILGESLLLIVLFVINYIDSSKYYDYILLLLIAVSITIFMSEKTYDYDILSVNAFYYLEKLSLPIFINHTTIIAIVNKVKIFSNFLPKEKSIIVVILTIIISITEMKIFDFFQKKGFFQKVKKIFIESN